MRGEDLQKLAEAIGVTGKRSRRKPRPRPPVVTCPVCAALPNHWCPHPTKTKYAHQARRSKQADYLKSLRVLPGHYGARNGG